MSRKIATTAAGSVVAMIAPRMMQASTPTGAIGHSAESDDEGADEDADDREQQHRRDLVAKLPDIDVERGIEQQRRQEDVKEGFGAEAEIVQRLDDVANHAAMQVGLGNVGGGTDRDPDQGQQHAVRD